LIEVSSESPEDLVAAQPGMFKLASVLFEVLAPGPSKIGIYYWSSDLVAAGNPPVVICPPDLRVASFSDIPAPDFAGGSVSDESDPNPQVTHAGDQTLSGLPIQIVRTYRAGNANGLSAICNQTITIQPDPGDLNSDGLSNRADLDLLMTKIRQHSSDSRYDSNGDGKVDIADARYFVVHLKGR